MKMPVVICVIMALKEESLALEKKLQIDGYTNENGVWEKGGIKIHIIRCGVLFSRKKQIEKLIPILKNCSLVVIAGICGAVNEKYEYCDIVMPDKTSLLSDPAYELEITHPDFNLVRDFLENNCRSYKSCSKITTSDHFVDSTEKEKLRAKGLIEVVDMESYNVYNWLFKNNISSVCIKCVSDIAREKLPSQDDLVGYLHSPAKFIFKNIIRNPILCFSLMRLIKNSKSASACLAGHISAMIAHYAQNKTKTGRETIADPIC